MPGPSALVHPHLREPAKQVRHWQSGSCSSASNPGAWRKITQRLSKGRTSRMQWVAFIGKYRDGHFSPSLPTLLEGKLEGFALEGNESPGSGTSCWACSDSKPRNRNLPVVFGAIILCSLSVCVLVCVWAPACISSRLRFPPDRTGNGLQFGIASRAEGLAKQRRRAAYEVCNWAHGWGGGLRNPSWIRGSSQASALLPAGCVRHRHSCKSVPSSSPFGGHRLQCLAMQT